MSNVPPTMNPRPRGIPRLITRSYQCGLDAPNPAAPGTISTKLLPNARTFVPSKFCVYPLDAVIVEVSVNGDPVGFEEDFDRCRAREYVDEDDPRWDEEGFEPPIQKGFYNVGDAMPLLHASDVVEVRLEFRGEGAQEKFVGMLLGTVHEEESEVQPYELLFDLGSSIEVGESREIAVPVSDVARIERLYVAGGVKRAMNFVIEQISVGQSPQLAVEASAGFLASCPSGSVLMESLSPKSMTAAIRVRNVGEMPRVFRGRLIGVALKDVA